MGLPLIWRAYFEFGSQKGCLAGTNSTGTLLTNVFSQRVHSSMPACSLGMWPMTIRALCLPSVAVSAAYSTVSHFEGVSFSYEAGCTWA